MKLPFFSAFLLVASACTSTPTTPADAGTDAPSAVDATTNDAGLDAERIDAWTPSDVGLDARDVGADAGPPDAGPPDAGPPDAGPAHTLLLIGGVPSGASMSSPRVATFTAGAWSTPAALGGTDHTPLGGGITFLADGRALAITHAYSTVALQAQIRTAGTWSSETNVAAGPTGNTSAPVASATGALVASMPQGSGGGVSVDELSASTSTWTRTGASGAGGADYFTRPAVGDGASNQPLVLGSDLSNYTWSQRIAGAWSGGAIPDVTPPAATGAAPGRSMAAIARAGTDRFLVALAGGGAQVIVRDFEAGTWSAPTTLASNLATLGSRNLFASALLPDGRIALFWITGTDGVAGGLLDGTTWTSIRDVPITVPVRAVASALSIAPGVDEGVVLELVYLGTASVPIHVRLMDAATWTWSTPTAVPGATSWLEVFVASNG